MALASTSLRVEQPLTPVLPDLDMTVAVTGRQFIGYLLEGQLSGTAKPVWVRLGLHASHALAMMAAKRTHFDGRYRETQITPYYRQPFSP